MSILPGFDRVTERFLESGEVVKHAAAFVVVSADRRFGKIKMTVPARVVAFSKKFLVLFVRERLDVQTVRGAEARLHSEENVFLRPDLGKEIVPLVQTDAMNRQGRDN